MVDNTGGTVSGDNDKPMFSKECDYIIPRTWADRYHQDMLDILNSLNEQLDRPREDGVE